VILYPFEVSLVKRVVLVVSAELLLEKAEKQAAAEGKAYGIVLSKSQKMK